MNQNNTEEELERKLETNKKKRQEWLRYVIVSTTSLAGLLSAILLLSQGNLINSTMGTTTFPALITMGAALIATTFVYLTTKSSIVYNGKEFNSGEEKEREKVFHTTVDKLEAYVSNLRNAGNLYLAIGSTLTLMATAFLILTLLKKQQTTDIPMLLNYYIPRIAIGILIEAFAFYFLKLFKENLKRIQHYQNEIITLETKYVALKEAKELLGSHPDILTTVLTEFAKTERNKGVNVESSGLSDKDALDALLKLIRR